MDMGFGLTENGEVVAFSGRFALSGSNLTIHITPINEMVGVQSIKAGYRHLLGLDKNG